MFKVQDLMIDVLVAGNGSVGMPAPTEPTPPPTISPIAAITAFAHKFEAIDKAVALGERIDLEVFENIAIDIGRAVVATRMVALCAQDMATCDDNARISPFASLGAGVLRAADFGVLRQQVLEANKWIDERGDLLEKRAVENKKDLIPRLSSALDYLQSR